MGKTAWRGAFFLRNKGTFILLLILSAFANKAMATHVYGADLFYKHISGNTYQVAMYIYGDCDGDAFKYLPGAPQVIVYNGTSLYTTLTLAIQSPTNGLEVTPVCPGQENNTKCKSTSNPIPGVKRFYYTANVTLNTTSTSWRFRFTGNMGNHTTGRSSNMTNIVNSGTSTMNLEATLNNTSVNNSSPTYNTIPTPFYCINKQAQYNPGIVDLEGDSIVHSLVPGLTPSGNVIYKTGFSATAPLSVASGSFSFSSTTGQLVFIPNAIQQSLVVTKAEEYRNGVLIGSSMREMTFIVWNCSNNPPGGFLSDNTTGTLDSTSTHIVVCKSEGQLVFKIAPTDLDTHSINITVSGLPTGASVSIANNSTKNSVATFTWNLNTLSVGTYTFYVTYLDDGCPIVSKQTQAYTVDILPNPKVTLNITSPATCVKKAVYTMTPSVAPAPWHISVLQGSTMVHDFTNVTTIQTDSLSPGTYTIRVENADSCFKDTTLTITSPPQVVIIPTVTDPICNGDSTGVVVLAGSSGLPGYTYAMGTGGFGSATTYGNLPAGTYVFKIRDQNYCTDDTTVTVIDPAALLVDSLIATMPLCYNDQNGQIKITGKNGTTPYTYAVGASAFTTNNLFTGLNATTHTLFIKDANNCTADTVYTLNQPTPLLVTLSSTQPACDGVNTGTITISGIGGTTSYTYAIGAGGYSSVGTFTALASGTYTLHVKDANGCSEDTTMQISDSLDISAIVSVNNALCYDSSNGKIEVVGIAGGNPYVYALDNTTYAPNNVFNGVKAGTHTVYVKDSFGCKYDTVVTVDEPAPIDISVSPNRPSCYGFSDGNVSITGSGGTPMYTYAFNSGGYNVNNMFTGLLAGVYKLSVKDSNGCVRDTMITLPDASPLGLSAVVTDVSCYGNIDGSIDLSASGGTPVYSYSVDQSAFGLNSVMSGLTPGKHEVTLKDSKGCLKDSTINVDEPDKLLLNVDGVINPTCEDFKDGLISVDGKGGVQPFSYSLNGGAYTSNYLFKDLGEGIYAVTIRDGNNCTHDTVVALTGYPNILLEDAEVEDVSCFGLSDGAIKIIATGGVQPFVYKFNNGVPQGGNYFGGLGAGTYHVTIIDSAGCEKEDEIPINAPAQLAVELQASPNNCDKIDNSGIIQAFVTGGTFPYFYTWSDSTLGNSDVISNIPEGRYGILIRDDNNCEDSTDVILKYDVCCRIFIPSAFTPNGDGLNDKIRILTTGEFRLKIFSIYNRFGERVFTTGNLEDGWDGVWQGKEQVMSTYNYYAIGWCGDDEVMYKGTITLIR
ncbi:MAG: gliding motility-associated C-terminal domain-containing protein [Chitinophagales bacterium]|nr:gliding motility-associated C-terminal domain-containing protein [Chitinophagaceae bacterium]MCB9064662.1 gliding motility-associated C-terminal domain-containing protein [Chitinophagales bacterium]